MLSDQKIKELYSKFNNMSIDELEREIDQGNYKKSKLKVANRIFRKKYIAEDIKHQQWLNIPAWIAVGISIVSLILNFLF